MKNKIGPFFLVALLSLCAVLFATNTWAEDSKTGAQDINTWVKDVWTRDKLTGDWRGLRSDLSKHGIDIGLRLSQYGQRVASGGVDQNSEYGGTMDYRVNTDLKKLLGSWDGLSVIMHARTRWGQDVSADAGAFALENAGLIMQLPGDYHGTDVTGLTVSQYLPFFGGLANVTLGMLDVVDTLNGFFPEIGYAQESFWNVNSLVSALPWFGAVRGLSLYGGIASTVNQKYKMAQSGVLFTGTQNESDSWGSISNAFDEGVWLAAFHRFFWELDGKMGYFMVFAGASTAEQASNDPNDFAVIPGQGIEDTEDKKPWDIAGYLYQVFWQAQGNPNRKATFKIGGTVGPDDPQFAQYNIFANIEGFGLMKSRPDDRMGVAGWYNWLSDNFEDLVSPLVDVRDTWGVELYYNIAINKWLHLTPDIQFIKNERGGRPDIPFLQNGKNGDDIAIIPGIRLVIDF